MTIIISFPQTRYCVVGEITAATSIGYFARNRSVAEKVRRTKSVKVEKRGGIWFDVSNMKIVTLVMLH